MSKHAPGISTRELAADLTRIVAEQTDYRARVDAIAAAIHGELDSTVQTALIVALASVSANPLQSRT